jgi:DNA-binding winged helix-turn-helix (wHTH) protein/Tol biopolymer transport system component
MVNDGKPLVFRFGDFELREKEHRLLCAGEELHLQPQVFRLLLYLVRNRDRVVQKDEIVREVWDSAAVTDNSLTRSIYLLRKILDDDPRDSQAIRTVSSIGYQFVCEVEQAEDCSSFQLAEVAAAGQGAAPEAPEISATASAGNEIQIPRRLQRFWLPASAIGVLALLAAGVWSLRRPLPAPRITAYVRITNDGHVKALGGTDGSRLYFTQISPQTIEQVGVNGGEVARVPTTLAATQTLLMDVSPDGTNALIGTVETGRAANPMWVAPLIGGAAKRLGDGECEVFSPDGLSVLYSTLGSDIFLERIDGTENRKLAHAPAYPCSFGWSPDRKAIRFTQGDILWEMSSDGSMPHRLLPDWKEPGGQDWGVWTLDGHFYLFDSYSPSNGEQIWVLDERRRFFKTQPPAPIRLTTGPVNWGRLIPSRDGTRIFAEGTTVRGELVRIDSKTGSFQSFLGGISAQDVSFSPDGRSVAYVAFPEGTLWRADRDGSHRIQLTRSLDYAGNPRWSPDSKSIVFGTASPSGTGSLKQRFSIHRISAEDGAPLWLPLDSSTDLHDPCWSPDGTRVLYGNGDPTRMSTPVKEDLRIVDLRTRQITIVPGSEGKWSPRWSPDGRYIAAFLADLSQDKLPVLDLATGQWRTIPVNGNMNYLSFSQDSRFIYFLRRNRDQGAFRVPVGGGREERVANLTDWHLVGYYGFAMSLDPTDAPLMLRDIGSDDIYALTLEAK